MEEKMSRRERKKIQSKQTILQAAVHVFSTKGFQETSIADIMNQADLGIGTFYNYFESKEDVLKCLLKSVVEEICQAFEKFVEDKCAPADILEKTVMLSARLLSENRFVLPLFLSAANLSGMPEGSAELPAEPSAFKLLFNRIIASGQDSGAFREDIPTEVVTELFHSMFQAASFSSLPMGFEENIRLKLQLVLDGLRAR